MRRASVLAFLVVGLFAPVTRAEPGPGEPLVVLQTKPVGELVEDVRSSVRQVGRFAARVEAAMANKTPGVQTLTVEELRRGQEMTKTILDFVGKNVADDWDKTIDASRPVLGYAAYDLEDPAQSPALLLVPIKGSAQQVKTFIGRIANVGEEDEGVFPITFGGNWIAHARVRNNTLYLTAGDKATLDTTRLVAPADLTAPLEGQLLAFRAYPSRLPPVLKQIIQFSWDQAVEQALKQAENDPSLPPAARELQKQWVQRVMNGILDVIKEGDEVSLGVAFDRKTSELGYDIRVSARKGTGLEKALGEAPVFESPLAGVLEGDPAGQLCLNLPLPAEIAKLVEEGIRIGFEEENAPTEEEKAYFEDVMKAVRPTLRGGSVQFAAGLYRSGETFTLVGGMALKNAPALEKMLRESNPPEGMIQFDADKIGGTSVHTIAPPEEMLEKLEPAFGDGNILFAFRKDALVFAFGPEAKAKLEKALKAPPKVMPQLSVSASLKQVVPLVKAYDEHAARMMETVLGRDIDKLSLLKIEWQGGKTFRLRYTSETLPVLLAWMFTARAAERVD